MGRTSQDETRRPSYSIPNDVDLPEEMNFSGGRRRSILGGGERDYERVRNHYQKLNAAGIWKKEI